MKFHRPAITLSVSALAVLIHALPQANAWLQFDRAAIARGEIWRWLTGHLTHFGTNHLLWDVGVLVGLGWLCEQQSRARCVLAMAASAAVIPLAIWWWQPQFATYRGLSGIGSALFGLAAASQLRRPVPVAKLVGALALLGFAGKSALELTTGATVFAAGADYAPVPLAHVIGVVVGVIAGTRFRKEGRREAPSGAKFHASGKYHVNRGRGGCVRVAQGSSGKR